jgi:hypothetical protein
VALEVAARALTPSSPGASLPSSVDVEVSGSIAHEVVHHVHVVPHVHVVHHYPSPWAAVPVSPEFVRRITSPPR